MRPRSAGKHGVFFITILVRDKSTHDVTDEVHESGPMTDTLALLEASGAESLALERALASLKGGTGHVTHGAEYGDSVEAHDGRWLTVRSYAEVKLPCRPSRDSIATAADIGYDLAHRLAVRGLERGRDLVQVEMMRSRE